MKPRKPERAIRELGVTTKERAKEVHGLAVEELRRRNGELLEMVPRKTRVYKNEHLGLWHIDLAGIGEAMVEKDELYGDRFLFVSSFNVGDPGNGHSGLRKQKLGSILLNIIKGLAKREKKQAVFLVCKGKVREFYEKNGFVKFKSAGSDSDGAESHVMVFFLDAKLKEWFKKDPRGLIDEIII
ncbi:MAG: hypothetical protein PHH82_01025 [Candidatus ainarchaeum sp.]|nr:hypothetical protein [Candidatus ainarchaeum sp.]